MFETFFGLWILGMREMNVKLMDLGIKIIFKIAKTTITTNNTPKGLIKDRRHTIRVRSNTSEWGHLIKGFDNLIYYVILIQASVHVLSHCGQYITKDIIKTKRSKNIGEAFLHQSTHSAFILNPREHQRGLNIKLEHLLVQLTILFYFYIKDITMSPKNCHIIFLLAT